MRAKNKTTYILNGIEYRGKGAKKARHLDARIKDFEKSRFDLMRIPNAWKDGMMTCPGSMQ